MSNFLLQSVGTGATVLQRIVMVLLWLFVLKIAIVSVLDMFKEVGKGGE